jgi:hypothetical protein
MTKHPFLLSELYEPNDSYAEDEMWRAMDDALAKQCAGTKCDTGMKAMIAKALAQDAAKKQPVKEDAIEDAPSMTTGNAEDEQEPAAPAPKVQKGKPFPSNLQKESTLQRFAEVFTVDRKQAHTCMDCGKTIKPGESYEVTGANQIRCEKDANSHNRKALSKAAKSAKKSSITGGKNNAGYFGDDPDDINKINESEHEIAASILGLKPLTRGKNQKFSYPSELSYGGRSWTKQPSGAEHWNGKTLEAIKYTDQYGNVLRVTQLDEDTDDAIRVGKVVATYDSLYLAKQAVNRINSNVKGYTVKAEEVDGQYVVKVVSVKQQQDEQVVGGDELCIYCSVRPVDPNWAPYCSGICAINASND